MLIALVAAALAEPVPVLHASEASTAVPVVARDARERERDLVPRTLQDFAPDQLSVIGADDSRCQDQPIDVLALQDTLTQADLLLTKGRSAKARAMLQRATASFVCLDRYVEPSTAARVWLLAGISAHIEEDPDAALVAYQQALIYRPDLEWDGAYTPEGEQLFLSARVAQDRATPGHLLLAPGVDADDVRVDGYPVTEGGLRLVPGEHLVQTGERTLLLTVEGGEQAWLVDPQALPADLLTRFGDPQVSAFLEVLLAGSGPLYVEALSRTYAWDGVGFQLLPSRRDPAPWVLASGAALVAGGGGLALWQVQRGLQAEGDGADAIAELDRGAHGEAYAEWQEARRRVGVGVGAAAVGVGLASAGVVMLSPGPGGLVVSVRR